MFHCIVLLQSTFFHNSSFADILLPSFPNCLFEIISIRRKLGYLRIIWYPIPFHLYDAIVTLFANLFSVPIHGYSPQPHLFFFFLWLFLTYYWCILYSVLRYHRQHTWYSFLPTKIYYIPLFTGMCVTIPYYILLVDLYISFNLFCNQNLHT